MKRLFIILLFVMPALSNAQILFRSGVFLTHSTGQNIWGPNGSPTSIPQEIQTYNVVNGFTGNQAISMQRISWPETPWDNEWERWHRIFKGTDPQANIAPIIASNKIVVIKSCYPSSSMTGWGQPSDTLNPTIKSVYNYKWHWRNIIKAMAEHPDNFFAIWTNAPLNEAATNPNAAMLSKSFCQWAKDTLALSLDPIIGAFPSNIYVFDYFGKLTDENGYQKPEYAVSTYDSHPNAAATALIAPRFVNEIFGAAIIYEEALSIISVQPEMQQVGPGAGLTTYNLTTLLNWTAQTNADWCTVTPSGSGSGTLAVSYQANPLFYSRTAEITVLAQGLPLSETVYLIQEAKQATLQVFPDSLEVSAAAGTAIFFIYSNSGWNASANTQWCSVTPSGEGDGEIVANYELNPSIEDRQTIINVNTTNGKLQKEVWLIQKGTPTDISNIKSEKYRIFPNPFSNQITFSAYQNGQTIVSLYSFLGQQVIQQPFTNSILINTERLADGIYFYELRNNLQIITTGKLIKH